MEKSSNHNSGACRPKGGRKEQEESSKISLRERAARRGGEEHPEDASIERKKGKTLYEKVIVENPIGEEKKKSVLGKGCRKKELEKKKRLNSLATK